MDIGKVFTDDVIVGQRHRALDASRVATLAESMKAIGLQTPISVYVDDEDAAHLVAGLHRLEAARRLDWEQIDCAFIKLSELDRELWEIAENLHRVDLTKDQRDAHIRRYAELIEARDASVAPTECRSNDLRADGRRKGPQHQLGTARKVAGETGLSVRTVQRVLAPPKPTATPAAPLNDYEATDKQVARLLAAWNAAGKDARERFLGMVDTPVMDRRYSDDLPPVFDCGGDQ